LAAEKGETIVWERIVGITPVPGATGQIIEGIIPVGFPWSVKTGRALVNLNNRRFHISVKGLAIGAMPTPLSPIGTTGVVTSIRGGFVCTDIGIVIDTDSVELSTTGDAILKGSLSPELDYCDPENFVLLLRVAEVLPGAPNITGSWLAYGAARRLGAPNLKGGEKK
jgi:hypothetical protein